jgi:hypothetical protein
VSTIQSLERKQVTLLTDLCQTSIEHTQINGPESFLYPIPHDTPKQTFRTLRKMHKEGLSLAIPVPDRKKSIESFIEAEPIELKDLYLFDENNLFICGDNLVEYIDIRLPGFKGTESGIFQGSAKLPCPENSDVEFAKKLVEEGKYLIIGGMGMPGSAMERALKTYLELGGKGVVVIITKQLNKSGTKHQEALNFIANNVVILTADDLNHRIPGFIRAGTQGIFHDVDTLISIGGNGTKLERKVLWMYQNIPGYGGLNVRFSNIELWEQTIEYDKLIERLEKINNQFGIFNL